MIRSFLDQIYPVSSSVSPGRRALAVREQRPNDAAPDIPHVPAESGALEALPLEAGDALEESLGGGTSGRPVRRLEAGLLRARRLEHIAPHELVVDVGILLGDGQEVKADDRIAQDDQQALPAVGERHVREVLP